MTDQELIKKTMNDVTELLLRKNRDYGSSFRRRGIVAGTLDAKSKLLVRIDDKLERLCNLMAKGSDGEVSDESVADTATDLIGYFVLLKILIDEDMSKRKPMGVIEAAEKAAGGINEN
jgi:hypothetical protein